MKHSNLKKHDYIELKLNNGNRIDCIVLEASKTALTFLPTVDFLFDEESSVEPIKIEMTYDNIDGFSYKDNYELLLMLDKNNDHLNEAIEGIFYNERKGSRKIQKGNL
jgi:hypothetical protein